MDGTLLNSNHVISGYTKEVIKKVHEKGVQIFIATGRHHKDAMVYKKMLGLDSYLITSNGATVHDGNDKEIIAFNIPADITTEIIDMEIAPAIHKSIYQGDFWYAEEISEFLKPFYKEASFPCHIKPFSELRNQEVTKFFYVCEDEEKLAHLEQRFVAKFDGNLNITYSLPICLELLRAGVSKGGVLKKILEKLNIKAEETIAFGDGLNDYEMLKMAGRGLIMGNANYRLQQYLPNNEVIDTNDNDGLAKYLTKLFL